MPEKGYTISQAAKRLNEKAYILRYWEEELSLRIPRNSMGYRYYSEYHIQLLNYIRELKRNGMSLKEIEPQIPAFDRQAPLLLTGEAQKNTKKQSFYRILNRLMDYEKSQREEELHCRKIDQAIRRRQQINREVAATKSP